MKSSAHLITHTIIIALTLLMASVSFAESTTYKCKDQTGCIENRVNFGTAQVRCLDVDGDTISNWVCEYEMKYSCENMLTGEVRSGGFDPLSESLCSKLCDSCKGGWTKINLKPLDHLPTDPQ
ncbi:hypothetical protein [Maridesulfovibrio zosterae]|uniref:hypothetical protein n=1 Tax=Maridesulfovibrio zosterae TaxID=82171 RepID=UPI00040ED3E0|nr:hypothetical protein [Maridesulfovibrio zosterae]